MGGNKGRIRERPFSIPVVVARDDTWEPPPPGYVQIIFCTGNLVERFRNNIPKANRLPTLIRNGVTYMATHDTDEGFVYREV